MAAPRIIAMILAGGRVGELSVLTLRRAKSAVPFGGMYRVIDCALTNIVGSGIENVGILSQYRPLSLMAHVGSGQPWDLTGYRRGVRFLPPRTGVSDADWYKGTADALYQNIDYMRNYHPDWVLIVSGDHIYRMNYGPLLELHASSQADVTMAVTPVEMSQAHRFGLVRCDSDGRVNQYLEKPSKPISNLASMTVYVFKWEVLIRELEINALSGHTYHIYDEILPKLVREGQVFAQVFNDYWSYSRKLQDYYQANMDCIGDDPRIKLTRWQLQTRIDGSRVGDPLPVLIGSEAGIVNSIISPGCEIHGQVINSVVSPYVKIQRDAVVRNSVVFEGSVIHPGSSVDHCIIDKNCEIGTDSQIGCRNLENASPNRMLGDLLSSGITVLGKNVRLPSNVKVGRNVLIFPDYPCDAIHEKVIPDGSTLSQPRDQEV